MKLFEYKDNIIDMRYKELREDLFLGLVSQIAWDEYFSVGLSEKDIFKICMKNILDRELSDAKIDYFIEFNYDLADDLFKEGINIEYAERTIIEDEDFRILLNIIAREDEKEL